jgi:hypothetical protein
LHGVISYSVGYSHSLPTTSEFSGKAGVYQSGASYRTPL